jgi:hypothetical protein
MWVSLAILTAAYTAIFVHSNETTTRMGLENLPGLARVFVANFTISRILIGLAVTIVITCFIEIIFISILEYIERSFISGIVVSIIYIILVTIVLLSQIPGSLTEVTLTILRPILLTGHGVLVGAVELYFATFGNSASVNDLLIYALFGDLIAPVTVLLGIATISFFDASGDYKEYYVEYLITEYTTIVKSARREEDNENRDYTTTQRHGQYGS